ncbi:MAG: TonB-dependent receptor, partial [Steroidobacteraceae bacterium]
MRAKALVQAVASTSLINALALTGAYAQGTAPSASGEPEVLALEEVVVTANRRTENVQRVPIAVTAFSAESALAHGITDMQSLANAVPGVRIDRATATALPFIRGVGSAVGQVSAEPPIAFYVDDVYIPAAGAALSNFNSVDSLEVAKGPQGTLFGRNATGGVIQVFTKNPTQEPALDVSLGYGNYDTKTGSFYATGGLSDTLSANIAAYGGDQGSGWGDNPTTGKDAFETNKYYGGRVKLLWEPSDATSVLFNLDHDNTKSSQGFYGPVKGTVGAGGLYAPPDDYYDLVDHMDPYWRVKQTGGSVKITQELNNFGKLVSVSAYRDSEQQQHWDQSGAPFPLVPVDIKGPTKTFTQELQLLSQDDSAVTWIAGLFYMHDESGYDPLKFTGPLAGLLSGGTASFIQSETEQKTDSYAAFAQVNWEIFDATHLTLGARYTIDEREITGRVNFGDALIVDAPNSGRDDKWKKPSWRIALDHQFTDDFMAYVAYNRGFKSGTFNAVLFPLPGVPLSDPVEPETLDAYTIGQKAEFFDNRIRVNSEVFYYKYKDMQLTSIVAGGTALKNAAEATIKGIDVDITATLFQGFTLTA